MKKILFSLILLTGITVYAQVGVNTANPGSSMDVSAKRNADGTLANNTQFIGLQAPRLTRTELTASTATYGTNQKGALVYITDVSGGDTASPRTNIDAVGYYYFDGTLWQKIINGAASFDNSNDAWLNDAANTMVKLGTKSDGSTARDAGTDFVAKDNGNVGIGTSSPVGSAILELSGSNKAFLLTRVALTGATDVTTVPSPVPGMLVYNLTSGGSNDSTVNANTVYYWNGTRWDEVKGTQTSEQTGSNVYKTKYRGRNLMANSYPKPTLLVPEANLEFRFGDNPAGTNRLQVRLTNIPTTTVSVFVSGDWAGQTNSGSYYDFTFTPANYNVWQNIDSRSWSGIWSYYFVIASNEVRASGYSPVNYVMNLYGLCGWGNGWGATNEPYSLAAEVF